MSLVKWIRKNERKLMATIVILIMVAFVGGSGLRWLMNRRAGGNKVVGTFCQGGKITPISRQQARAELEILERLESRY